MFCPKCGASQPDELKFCKACGTNLEPITQMITGREPQFDWNKTWMSQILLSKEEIDRRKGITPEIRRYNEIKGGVITSIVGLGLMLFLAVFMEGIILSGKVEPGAAEILSRLWICGVIPVFVGLALIFNGLFVSKKVVELKKAAQAPEALGSGEPKSLKPADTSEFVPTNFSVTEGTTRTLSNSSREQ
jgi:hypothetical protein